MPPPTVSSTECCQTSGFLLMQMGEGYLISSLWGRGERAGLGTSGWPEHCFTHCFTHGTRNTVNEQKQKCPPAFLFLSNLSFLISCVKWTVKLILPWVYGSLDILKNIYLFDYAWSLLQHVGSSSLTRLPPNWEHGVCLSHGISRKSQFSGYEYQDRFE